jgi:hypothetical protein
MSMRVLAIMKTAIISVMRRMKERTTNFETKFLEDYLGRSSRVRRERVDQNVRQLQIEGAGNFSAQRILKSRNVAASARFGKIVHISRDVES